jgi:protoporphyrinogen oxidase
MQKKLLDAGVTLRTGSPVARIETAPERRVRLQTGEALAFDRCLFTGPSDVFARLLPDEPALAAYRRQLGSVTYLGAICVILVTDQALGRHHWTNIHDPQAPFLVMIDHTALTGTDLYQGKHVYYLGCYCPQDSRWFSTDDAALLDEWLGYLGRIDPAFDRSRLGERHVFRFRNAQHVVDCGYEANIPSFRTPLAGVYLANFSQIFPYDRGTNFAIRDGLRLARLVLDDMATGPPGTHPTAERS